LINTLGAVSAAGAVGSGRAPLGALAAGVFDGVVAAGFPVVVAGTFGADALAEVFGAGRDVA